MRTATVVATLLVATLSLPVRAQQAERYTFSGNRIALFTLAGRINAEPATGPDVIVEVTRGGRDAAQLRVLRGELARMPGFETLRVAFPEEDIVYPTMSHGSRTDIRWYEDGTFGGGYSRRDRRPTITISGSGPGIEAWADLRIMVPPGCRIDLNLGVGEVAISNVDGEISVDASSAPVSARGTRGTLDVDTGSGRVTVTDAAGALSIDTGSGDVEITTFRGTGFSIDTGSGDILASAVTADIVNVDTGSGAIILRGVSSPDIDLDAASGDVEVALAGQVGALRVETASGSVLLQVPASTGASIDVETHSGGIETDLPLEVTRWGNDRVTGRVGDGTGQIDIETASGRVRIVKGA